MNKLIQVFKELSFSTVVEEAHDFTQQQEHNHHWKEEEDTYYTKYFLCVVQVTSDTTNVFGTTMFFEDGFFNIVASLKMAYDVFMLGDDIEGVRFFEDGTLGISSPNLNDGTTHLSPCDILNDKEACQTHNELAHRLLDKEECWRKHMKFDRGFQGMMDRETFLKGFDLLYDNIFQEKRYCSFQPMLAFASQLEKKYILTHLADHELYYDKEAVIKRKM